MQSERRRIVDFFREINADDLVALPPTRERFDQQEGHAEARQVATARGIADPCWVFWHHQSAWVFDANDDLSAGLLLHWGGDHDRVQAALTAIPAPFRVIDHGLGGAFEIVSDHTEARRTAAFPDVSDTKAVKARIQAITGPVARHQPDTWTPEELAWFERVLLEGELPVQSAVVGWVTMSPELSAEAVDHLAANWTSIYPKSPNWVLVTDLLHLLDQRGDPRLNAMLDIAEKRRGYVFRAGASLFLTNRLRADPHGASTETDIERLARFAHDPGRYEHTPGNSIALRGLVEALALRQGQPQSDIAAALLQDTTFDASARNALNKVAHPG